MFFFTVAVALLSVVAARLGAGQINQPVTELSVPQYLGLWYEMYADAIVLKTIQKGAYCSTALYGDNGDGTLSVYNYQTVDSPSGLVSDIYGYAYIPDSSQPGKLIVHLDGTPADSPYWVLALGPVYDGLYDWAIVSDNLSFSLFILARNYTRFDALYKDDVLKLSQDLGLEPIDIYQADDCVYASTTRAEQIKANKGKFN